MTEQSISNDISEIYKDKDLLRIYFNGFLSTVTTGDMLVVLKQNDVPVAVLNLSHTVAKSLAQSIGTSIVGLEDAIGLRIPTTREIQSALETELEKEIEMLRNESST